MSAEQAPELTRCPSCRGRGWTFIRSRRYTTALLIKGVLDIVTRAHCRDWDGGAGYMTGTPGVPVRVATSASSWKCARTYPGRVDQIGQARRFITQLLEGCPLVGEAQLICSELAANAVLHSASRQPGGRFIVRVEAHEGDYLWIEVEDQGGPWAERDSNGERGRGLHIVAALAAEWGIEGDAHARIVWARLDRRTM